jgi:hypothetical protein
MTSTAKPAKSPMDTLKLAAFDSEDLAVVSAHLQDAVLKVSDMTYLPREKRFALIVNRFDWQDAQKGEKHRRRTGLHFDRVMKASRHGVPLNRPDTVLNLLAITFNETDTPAGYISLLFSGGAEARLEVECLEAAMADLGPVWSTGSQPNHTTLDDGKDGH